LIFPSSKRAGSRRSVALGSRFTLLGSTATWTPDAGGLAASSAEVSQAESAKSKKATRDMLTSRLTKVAG